MGPRSSGTQRTKGEITGECLFYLAWLLHGEKGKPEKQNKIKHRQLSSGSVQSSFVRFSSAQLTEREKEEKQHVK